MPIIVIQSEKTVGELIEKCYSGLPTAQLEAVKAATLEANPHLGSSAELRAGMVIIVPPLQNAAVSECIGTPVSGEAVKAISDALSEYQHILEQKIGRRQDELKHTEVLREAVFSIPRISQIPNANNLINSVTQAITSEKKELDTANSELITPGTKIKSLKNQLEKLVSRLP